MWARWVARVQKGRWGGGVGTEEAFSGNLPRLRRGQRRKEVRGRRSGAPALIEVVFGHGFRFGGIGPRRLVEVAGEESLGGVF